MKKLVAVLLGVFFALSLSGVAQAAGASTTAKLGYVDLSRTFADYKKTKDFDKVLSDKENSYKTEIEKKINDLKQAKDKFDLLSDKEKEAKKADLEAKYKAASDFERAKLTDLRKEQDEKMKNILKDIEDAVKKYSEKEGYTFVFNDKVLVYQDKTLDITDKILDILNKGYKK